MIEVFGYGEEVTKGNGLTNVRSVGKNISITKLKNMSTGYSQCAYYGFCPDYDKEFPTVKETGWDDIQGDTHGWVHIIKNKNKGIKLPVLKWGEEVEL